MTGYIVFAHGSSLEAANEAVRRVAREAADRAGWSECETAFLGGGHPLFAEAVDRLAARGVRRVVVVPYFLTSGTHIERDLPALVRTARDRHPDVEIEITAPLDGHPGMVEAVLDRAREAN